MDNDLNCKEAALLRAMETVEPIRFCDLPNGIGIGTVIKLIGRGLIEQVPNRAGPYSKDAMWRKVRS